MASHALEHVSTSALVDLLEYLLARPFDEGLNVLIMDAMMVLQGRLPVSVYRELQAAVDAETPHP